MTILRWILGISTGAFVIGWGFLLLTGDDSSSPGRARPAAWLRSIIPVAVAILFLAALLWPERGLLLHAGAVVAVALLGFSLFLARETVFVACLSAAYCVGWLIFYYRSVFGAETVLPAP